MVLSCTHVSCSGVVRLTRVVESAQGFNTPSNTNRKRTRTEVLALTRYELPGDATRTFPLTFTALGSRLARQGLLTATLVVSVRSGPYATSGVDVTDTSGSVVNDRDDGADICIEVLDDNHHESRQSATGGRSHICTSQPERR